MAIFRKSTALIILSLVCFSSCARHQLPSEFYELKETLEKQTQFESPTTQEFLKVLVEEKKSALIQQKKYDRILQPFSRHQQLIIKAFSSCPSEIIQNETLYVAKHLKKYLSLIGTKNYDDLFILEGFFDFLASNIRPFKKFRTGFLEDGQDLIPGFFSEVRLSFELLDETTPPALF